MMVEVGVFGGEDALDQRRRHVFLRHHDALLDGVFGEGDAVAVVDPGDDGRLVLVDPFDGRNLDGVREEEADRRTGDQRAEDDEHSRAEPVPRGSRCDVELWHALSVLQRADAEGQWLVVSG